VSEIRWLNAVELDSAKEFEWPGKLLPGFARKTPQACFSNSQELVLQRDGLRYVEGTAWQHGSPLGLIHHGWVINDDDQVIDTTWTDRKRAPRIYRGIVVADRDEIVEHVRQTMSYDPYLCCMSDWCYCIKLLDELE
jgi:hypothetical protein